MNKFKYLCSKPSCSCFSVEQYTDIDGNEMVSIQDPIGNVCIDSLQAFDELVNQYLKYKGENK